MASAAYEKITGESMNPLLSSDPDDIEEGPKLKLAEKEEDDGFEEINEKHFSAEFEGREPFTKAAMQFQNGHGYEGVNGKGEHNERKGHTESSDDEDDGSNYREELIDDTERTSTEYNAEEFFISVPFYGKTYVAPEYSNFHPSLERTKDDYCKDASDADEPQHKEHFDDVGPLVKEREPEGVEEKYQSEHSAKEDPEDEEDTTLSEEESDEDEDEDDVEQQKRMEVDKEADVQEEKEDEIDNLNPQLAQEDCNNEEHDEGIDNEDVEVEKGSIIQHSDSLQVNVSFTSTVDTAEVDVTEGLDDEGDDKEDGENDQSQIPDRSPGGSLPPETDGEEKITCSKEARNEIHELGNEDAEEPETLCKEKTGESVTADRMEREPYEVHVYENVTDYSNESGSEVNTMATESVEHLQNQVDTNSSDEMNISADLPDVLASNVTDAEAEHVYSELEDGGIDLEPIGECDVNNDEETDDENIFAVHRNPTADKTPDSDFDGKVKELGRIFEGGGPVFPKTERNSDSSDGIIVSVRKFKALFEQDRSSAERAREPDRREDLMGPPRGIVKNLRGLFENPQGFEARKG